MPDGTILFSFFLNTFFLLGFAAAFAISPHLHSRRNACDVGVPRPFFFSEPSAAAKRLNIEVTVTLRGLCVELFEAQKTRRNSFSVAAIRAALD